VIPIAGKGLTEVNLKAPAKIDFIKAMMNRFVTGKKREEGRV